MAKLDLTKYGITGTTEVVYNPSYEQLFAEETKPGLEGYEKGQVSELVLDDLDAALFKERIERFHIHPALCGQSFGLLCRQGAFAFRQQFLQSHAHFALSFSLRGKRPASELVS